ncbi:MAG: hypothetical protein EOM08_01975 [Clostridia bacterium]|nr:hypothetical protein [Clostridia bacterium]NCC75182.1 hypothetical protein [Clostridia bacterium]
MKQSPNLQDIQEAMKPGSLSAEGFLGTDDRSLSDILQADQQTVRRLGVTDQAIAAAMRRLTEAAKTGLGKPIELDGLYEATDDEFMGRLPCPFRDNFKAEKRITTVHNLATGQTMAWSDLNIHMIEAHGFYEGFGSHYRLEPAGLVDFLGGVERLRA